MKKFNFFSPTFFIALLLTHSLTSLSFYNRNLPVKDFHGLTRGSVNNQHFDWLYATSLHKNVYKNSLQNQITITTVLKTAYCTGEVGSISFDASGVFNSGNRFSVQLSNFNGNFTNPTIIGFINAVTVGTNNVSFKIPLGILAGNGYRMRIVASNPVINSVNNGVNIQITTLPIPSVAISSQIICPMGSANLFASCSSGTVKWYNAPENGTLITNLTVSPTVSTDYFAACEDGLNCSSVRAKQIIIVNKPNVLIPPSASSCLNSDLSLTVVTEESNLSYTWTGPNSFSSSLQNPTVTTLTQRKTGVYSVRITNANSCLVTGTTAVSVGSVLQNLSVVGDVNICFGDSIKLTANGNVPSGMTYSWSSPDSFTATGKQFSRPASKINDNNLITYHRGLYTVVAYSPVSGCFGTTSLNISVGNRPNIPSILPAGSACEGERYVLNMAISGASFRNYVWTGPDGFSAFATASCNAMNSCSDANVTIANFSPPKVGAYSLKATFVDENNRLCEFKAIKNVTLKSSPAMTIGSNSTVCLGDVLLLSTTLNSNATGVSSYAWSGPNNFTSSAQNPVIYTSSVSGTGMYRLSATGVNSCVATATTFANVVESVPPTIVPTAAVVLSNSITLTASGCNGILNWYETENNQLVAMPVSPTTTTLYHVRCNVLGCLSGKSNNLTVSIKPPVAISVKTGNWEDKETWDIVRVPLPIDSVIIRPTHFITINSSVSAKWLAWSGFGNLQFASSKSKLNLLGVPTPPVVSPPIVPPVVLPPTIPPVVLPPPTIPPIITIPPIVIIPPIVTTVSPPVITSNPITVIEGIPMTLSATGTGVISWYKNGVILNGSGANLTVTVPVLGDVYAAKTTIGEVTSAMSNGITVVVGANSSGVTITTPNKPPYYFSDGHPPSYYDGNIKLPAIFVNEPRYDAVNDFVWLKNDKIKIGINLKRGGQLAWASLANSTTNLVYNGYDGGFQVTLDAYQKRDGYTQGGEVAGSGIPGQPSFSYNVTQGGDFMNNAVSLIDYHEVPNGYYVKIRPIHYPLTAKLSETYIEATYTIIGRSVKIDYRYTSFRTDGQWTDSGFDGAGAPACFIVNTLNKYKTFTGASPWSFLPSQGGNLPIQNMGQNPAGTNSTEHWGMVYDENNPNSGIGVYNATPGGNSTYFIFKQLEVYPGNGPGTEFTNGFTFFQPFIDFRIANRGNYVKDITAYMIIGSELDIRTEVYKFSGHAGNIPRF